MTDTHCHLTDEAFASDAEACIQRAREAGVSQIMLACCEEADIPRIATMCEQYPDMMMGSAGIHPENMADDVMAQLDAMRQCCAALRHRFTPRAIGEIGIDLHWDKTRLDDQLRLLAAQLDWARELDLPVLLHIRDAMPQFLEFLRAYNNNIYKASGSSYSAGSNSPRIRGILHCYSGTPDEAREAMELGDFYFGVGGTVTYKRSLVPDVVRAVGIERLVFETDAPYLAPVPHRGKRNEPAFTADTARFVADLLGITTEEADRITTGNARRLFG